MPGFNLRSSGLQHPDKVPYHNDGLERTEWSANDYFEFTGQYPENYPHEFIERHGSYFEGMVYNLDPKKHFKELTDLLDAYHFDEVIEKIRDWDGEFIFMHRDRSSKSMYIVNDSWGRLPVYYWQEGNQFIASRNISCITHFAQPKYNRLHLGMNLLLGTDLGTNTIWKKVHRMPPRSILHIHGDGHISLYEYFYLNTVDGNKSLKEVAPVIQEKFDESLKNRLEKLKRPTISLSGGLDSRLIAAGAKKLGMNVPCITYSREDGADYLDDASSDDIVKRLEIKNHEVFQIHPPQLSDAEELLQFKQGINYLSMSYVLPYYRMHAERGLTTITGDGGGKFFVDLSALKSIRSMKSLMRYIMRYNAFCSIETAAKLVGISAMELEENIMGHLDAYPFASYDDKYVYYLIREAGINWAFEGEDRNRQFVWSTTPFYNPSLIETCLSIPQSAKEYGSLYHHLYHQYPGNLHEVMNPNWKEEVANQKEVRRIHNRQKLKAFLPERVLEARKNKTMQSFVFQEELKQLINTHNGILNLKGLSSKHSMNFYWQLFTVLKLMEDKDS
ncbi:MAG: asparagine synthase-related protein [bacterium]|nr:asparagine synthase-related protein [bacterium]